ncbi:MAG: alpha/beta hydrolase [Deltaproteobacteria bacterium]|nr:alpha/beta hydrolase [Deltaproteobacteria bacterium]
MAASDLHSLDSDPPRSRGDFVRSSTPKLVPLLVHGSAAAASLLGATGCAELAHANLIDPLEAQRLADDALLRAPIDEAREATLLERAGSTGALIELSAGGPGAPTLVTIHGINGAPDSVDPLNDRGVDKGERVLTFAYDDRHSRLTTTSNLLARQLSEWMSSHPGETLRIEAHSMGGRIALGALGKLQASGQLSGPVELVLIAPPLAGYGSANGARMLPAFFARLIGGAMPGKDMGTRSGFQKMLERLRLPENVKSTIYVASDDTIASPESPTNAKIARNLGARLIRVDGADHDSVISRVASGDTTGFVDITPVD